MSSETVMGFTCDVLKGTIRSCRGQSASYIATRRLYVILTLGSVTIRSLSSPSPRPHPVPQTLLPPSAHLRRLGFPSAVSRLIGTLNYRS